MKLRRWWRRGVKKVKANPSQPNRREAPANQGPITRERIEQQLRDVDDITIKDFVANGETITIFYIGPIVDETRIRESIILPLQRADGLGPERVLPMAEPVQHNELSTLVQNLVRGSIGLPILKQMLEDKPYSPFPQFGLTNRPDNAVSALLDGRIVVIQNNSPDAIVCPASFLELFSSPEDFYNRWSVASLMRMIRFIGLFVTILLRAVVFGTDRKPRDRTVGIFDSQHGGALPLGLQKRI